MLRVTRQGPEAVHFVSSPLEVGQEVQVKVDWERRFDHMQQHSGKEHATNGQGRFAMFTVECIFTKVGHECTTIITTLFYMVLLSYSSFLL